MLDRGNRSYLLMLLLAIGISSQLSYAQGVSKITRYFVSQTIVQPPASVKTYMVKQEEGFFPDTLFQVLSKDGNPIAYYRNIAQEVCFDKKCRLLRLNLYWNVTGRYLGIELPVGEYLSKTEHEPFSLLEYQQLNAILSDSLSPLANFSYSALVPKADTSYQALDAVTSPTSPEVVRYVIPGAVYTTYALWHLVYGKTRDDIIQLTEKGLTADLLTSILGSPDRSDRFWALDRVGRITLDTGLQRRLMDLISDSTYNLAEKTLKSFRPPQLSAPLQQDLMRRFDVAGYSLKSLILNKLTEATPLSAGTAQAIADRLNKLQGDLLISVFRLFKQQAIRDPGILRQVAELMDNKNPFVSRQAYIFLKSTGTKDPGIQAKMKDMHY